jgi:hypothetical protein
MNESHQNPLAAPPRPATWLGRALLVGAVVTAALGTTAPTQAQAQKGPAGAEKAPYQRALEFIPYIDLDRDKVHGKWEKNGKLLQCNDQHFVPRVQIRYEPPREYDFIIEFSQTNLRHAVAAIMPNPHGGGSFVWKVGVRNGSDYCLLANPQQNWYWKAPGLIRAHTKHTTVVQVRRDSIRCLLDGRELLRRQTDFKDLTCDGWHKIPHPEYLGVGCDDPTVFYKVRLVEITGRGKAR